MAQELPMENIGNLGEKDDASLSVAHTACAGFY
jgi:hypothetical protein